MHLVKRSFLFLSLLFLCLCSSSRAFSVPKNAGWVTDLADIFTPTQEVDISTHLAHIASGYDAEIAVLTIPSLENEDIDMVGTQIAQERGIGNKERDTGILVLIAPAERKWRIDVGYGLEGVIPDAYAYRYGQSYLVPAFQQEKYADGVIALLTKFQEHLEGKPDEIPSPLIDDLAMTLFFAGMMIMFVVLSFFKNKKTITQRKAIRSLGIWSAGLALLSAPFVTFFAFLFFFLRFVGSVLIYVAPVVQVNSAGSRGSWGGGGTFSGGFGGFGGGSFGGGGASGGR